MRVLISTAGSHGDILPFIALAREFAARGHEPVLYSNPYFEKYAVDSGLAFRPVGTVEQYRTLTAHGHESDPKGFFKRVAREFSSNMPALYRAMREDVLPGRTIAIGGSLLFAHRLLKETDGVPCATVHLSPVVFQSNIRPPRLDATWIDAGTPEFVKRLAWWVLDRLYYEPGFTAPLNRLRDELGLPPIHRIFHSWIHEADCLIGLFPDWFAEPQVDWPTHAMLPGFPLYDHAEHAALPPALEAFLGSGTPPVAFTAGTATSTAHAFFETSVRACALSGHRAILLTHFPEQIPGQLPQGVIHVDYAPFSALLPRLAAFVHPGGIGATSQALKAGVPQLIRPTATDQFDNAARAVRLGVAREVLPKRYSPRKVATQLQILTGEEGIKQRCLSTATRFADTNAIEGACDEILRRLQPACATALS